MDTQALELSLDLLKRVLLWLAGRLVQIPAV